VYITANGQIFPADSVRKNVALNRFEPRDVHEIT